jgi:ubiquinone biosynthesis protein
MRLLSLVTRKGRRRFARYRRIVSTLVAYGFGEIVYQTGVGKLLYVLSRPFRSRHRREGATKQEATTWVRMRMVIEHLGPTFIKLGQILSNRPDLIPRPLQQELARLRDDVPPFPAGEAIKIIERELGRPVEVLFHDFNEQPIAAASVAQIHRATLPGGEAVVVKVQRPGLDELAQVDVEILKELAGLIERHFPETRRVSPRDIAAEFEQGIRQELDFMREASAIERFAGQFHGDDGIKVPKVYRAYGGKRVLTMEFMEGRRMSELLDAGPKDEEEGARIAAIGADLTLKQIFTYGYFHADPHPGNILVLEDGKLCYVDFGLTGNLIQRDREVVSDLLISMIGQNEQKAAKAVIRLAGSRDYQAAQKIEREIAQLIDRFQTAQAGDYSFTSLLGEVIEVLVDVGLRLPSDLFLLVKTLMTIEGVATGLDPNFDFTAHLKPFVETLVRERYSQKRIGPKVLAAAEDYGELLQSIPGDYYRLVDVLSNGRQNVSLDENSIRSVRRTVLQATSAMVFAIVLGSLTLGSAVIVHSKVPPLWHEVSVIGIIGFVAAGVVGLGLVVKILRTGGF